jgi:hypothetical protein
MQHFLVEIFAPQTEREVNELSRSIVRVFLPSNRRDQLFNAAMQ